MAIVAADWSIDSATGNIRYEGGDHNGTGGTPSYATVIEFHRWLQGLADDAVASGDDELDITNVNPSSRSTDNIITLLGNYNIDDQAAEHLYDGSIIQGTGGTEVYYDGIVNFGNADVQIQIIQNGAVLADDWWNYNGAGLNADAAQGVSHRFMIKTRTAGADIDGRRLIGTTRTFGNTYGEFKINGTARGNNVLALSDSTDLNNETAAGTVSGWTTIVNNTEGFVQLNIDNTGGTEDYYSEWTRDTYSINQFYERLKWLTRDGSASTLYGLNGELFRGITHEITYGSLTGTFDEGNLISWSGTFSGTGQVLADNGTNKVWIQLLTGVAPAASDSLSQSSPDAASATVSSVTDRSSLIKTPFVGQSTGSALIGSYGLGMDKGDVTAADKFFDLTNAQITPPNNVTFTVTGLDTDSRVLVAPWDGTTLDAEGDPEIDYNQLSLGATLNTDNITTVTIGAGLIPSDTPSTGYIRVADNNGYYRRLHYTSWENTGGTFTIDTTDGNEDFGTVNATSGNNVFIAYIDVLSSGASASFTAVYNTDRDLVVIVRDGASTPTKQYIASATFGSANSSVGAILTTDA